MAIVDEPDPLKRILVGGDGYLCLYRPVINELSRPLQAELAHLRTLYGQAQPRPAVLHWMVVPAESATVYDLPDAQLARLGCRRDEEHLIPDPGDRDGAAYMPAIVDRDGHWVDPASERAVLLRPAAQFPPSQEQVRQWMVFSRSAMLAMPMPWQRDMATVLGRYFQIEALRDVAPMRWVAPGKVTYVDGRVVVAPADGAAFVAALPELQHSATADGVAR